MSEQPRVVAAVDFGTHGTGFAWMLRNDPDKRIYYYDQWSGQRLVYPKNLSALLLDGEGSVVAWGHDAHERHLRPDDGGVGLTYHAHFKMDLQPGGPGSGPGLSPSNPDAVRLTTLCLREIYRFALDHITGHTSGIGAADISWRLTVPAIWRDRERQLMRAAAEKAGFPAGPRLELAIEPEAAAQHCWDHPAFVGIATPGTRFLVVDAGSGTVDITSYLVQGTVDQPQLAELSRASGGKLGASFVDSQFLGPMVQQRLGIEASWRLLVDGAVRQDLLGKWERAKRDFDPARTTPLQVELPQPILKALYTVEEDVRAHLAEAQNGVDGAIVLQPAEAKALFDHALDPMVELVSEHLAAIGQGPVPYLLLVGGFAESRYLQARFRAAFAGRVAGVLIAPQPAVAVMFGAVKSGLRPAIISRVSRFTYGINVSMPFEHSTDPIEKQFEDGYRVLRCRDRFDVFVRSGDSLPVGVTASSEVSPSGPNDTYVVLYIHTTENHYPRFTDEPGSTQVGKLRVDVSSTVGRPAEQRAICVTMTFGHAEITVHAVDVNGGGELSTTVDFVTRG